MSSPKLYDEQKVANCLKVFGVESTNAESVAKDLNVDTIVGACSIFNAMWYNNKSPQDVYRMYNSDPDAIIEATKTRCQSLGQIDLDCKLDQSNVSPKKGRAKVQRKGLDDLANMNISQGNYLQRQLKGRKQPSSTRPSYKSTNNTTVRDESMKLTSAQNLMQLFKNNPRPDGPKKGYKYEYHPSDYNGTDRNNVDGVFVLDFVPELLGLDLYGVLSTVGIAWNENTKEIVDHAFDCFPLNTTQWILYHHVAIIMSIQYNIPFLEAFEHTMETFGSADILPCNAECDFVTEDPKEYERLRGVTNAASKVHLKDVVTKIFPNAKAVCLLGGKSSDFWDDNNMREYCPSVRVPQTEAAFHPSYMALKKPGLHHFVGFYNVISTFLAFIMGEPTPAFDINHVLKVFHPNPKLPTSYLGSHTDEDGNTELVLISKNKEDLAELMKSEDIPYHHEIPKQDNINAGTNLDAFEEKTGLRLELSTKLYDPTQMPLGVIDNEVSREWKKNYSGDQVIVRRMMDQANAAMSNEEVEVVVDSAAGDAIRADRGSGGGLVDDLSALLGGSGGGGD